MEKNETHNWREIASRIITELSLALIVTFTITEPYFEDVPNNKDNYYKVVTIPLKGEHNESGNTSYEKLEKSTDELSTPMMNISNKSQNKIVFKAY
ncbi:MAG: hypothetical protein EPN82_13245 [Bacteroidetes bacterium]|nr:MAG: hypothetical protein EPN82_13245 [Bacteroidota bacterium]